uniref:RRP15-like protein n=1 Tax=Paramoeba aestuarina TaxID=180227 RepID=A0A7S4KGE1_9EUKA|mmetsp:Transcript_18657/g.29252  ORF Transcript_18657/g.29252 Transcript_18657/m.29252 type:complete len:191 (+) Transcript_18657:51-623(+)
MAVNVKKNTRLYNNNSKKRKREEQEEKALPSPNKPQIVQPKPRKRGKLNMFTPEFDNIINNICCRDLPHHKTPIFALYTQPEKQLNQEKDKIKQEKQKKKEKVLIANKDHEKKAATPEESELEAKLARTASRGVIKMFEMFCDFKRKNNPLNAEREKEREKERKEKEGGDVSKGKFFEMLKQSTKETEHA